MRRLLRWLADWRNGVTFIGTALVILLGVSVIHNAQSGHRAQQNARDAIAAAKQASKASQTIADNARHRIDLLTGQIADLQRSAESNGDRISELLAEVNALQEQIRQMGGRPVVVTPGPTRSNTTTTTVRPSPQPQPAPPGPQPPVTTTTTVTTPQPCPTIPVIGCIPSKERSQ